MSFQEVKVRNARAVTRQDNTQDPLKEKKLHDKQMWIQQGMTKLHVSRVAGAAVREAEEYAAGAQLHVLKHNTDHSMQLALTALATDAARKYAGLALTLKQVMAATEQSLTSSTNTELVSHIHLTHEHDRSLQECMAEGIITEEDYQYLKGIAEELRNGVMQSSLDREARFMKVLRNIELQVTQNLPTPDSATNGGSNG